MFIATASEVLYVGKPQSSNMYLAGINCDGSENSLSHCGYTQYTGATGGEIYDGKVQCLRTTNPSNGMHYYKLAKIHCLTGKCTVLIGWVYECSE